MRRPGGKYGPPARIDAATIIGDSDSSQGGGAGQGQGGGGEQSTCVREDLDRASQVLATAFKVLTHSLHYIAIL